MRRITEHMMNGTATSGASTRPPQASAGLADLPAPASGLRLLLSSREAAAAMSMSERWLWEATKAGKIA